MVVALSVVVEESAVTESPCAKARSDRDGTAKASREAKKEKAPEGRVTRRKIVGAENLIVVR